MEFWTRKLDENVRRDAAAEAAIAATGWRVVVIWECEVRTPGAAEAALSAWFRPDLATAPADQTGGMAEAICGG